MAFLQGEGGEWSYAAFGNDDGDSMSFTPCVQVKNKKLDPSLEKVREKAAQIFVSHSLTSHGILTSVWCDVQDDLTSSQRPQDMQVDPAG